MRKFLLIVLVVAAYLAYTYRFRLFVRDPLAHVTRAQVAETGAQVYLNFGNDVVLENDRSPAYLEIVQHDQPVAAPHHLRCLQYLACLADSYPITDVVPVPGATVEAMDPQQVRFRDAQGHVVEVRLR